MAEDVRRYLMASDTRRHLVVIGSGWVGLYIAQYIDTALYTTTVISPRRTSAYTPLLASAAVGLFPFSCAEESLRTKGHRVNFVKANALDVDFGGKKVRCEPAFEGDEVVKERVFDVGYDVLVVAPGCRTNTFGTPGVEEHALFMKHVSDAMALRKRLFDRLEQASLPNTSTEEAAALLHCAIVGGGPTGVEITAELSDLARRELKDLYPQVAHLLRITIYDVADHILGAYDRKLYEYATEHMAERGVTVATSCVIEKVDSRNLYIKGKGVVPYGILLWVAGNKSVPLVDALDVLKTKRGLVRILTDASLHVRKTAKFAEVYEDVFALGDAADIDRQPLPTTAEVAVQKSKYLVEHFNKSSTMQDMTMQPFAYKSKGLVTYLGGHDGIVEGRSTEGKWSGRAAWLSWRSGSFTWTRTWRNWVGILSAMAINAVFGRDVMRL